MCCSDWLKWLKPRSLSIVSFLLILGTSFGTYYITLSLADWKFSTNTLRISTNSKGHLPDSFWLPWWILDLIFFSLTVLAFLTTSLMDPGFYPVAPEEEDLEDSDTAPLHQTVNIENTEVKMKW